ncbi:MAG TPA: RyR domain-containing protein [Coleofasciculaceae cyanobacterium]
MNYKPEPIDTSNVTLTAEHLKLTELLAKNTHELWAQQRFADGWTYGTQRDDTRKEHPCLIPYDDLPESEKEYDHITALGVLKEGIRDFTCDYVGQTPWAKGYGTFPTYHVRRRQLSH